MLLANLACVQVELECLEQLQRFCTFCLAKDGVCQLSNQYGDEKKKVISNGLAKLTCQNPKKETRRRGREERTRE
jgi:hypothetical protein